MAKNVNTYNEDSIQVLQGLEAVRKRPGMYIGSTDARGLHHLVWEIIDNAIDEALSGYGDKIIVNIHIDNSIEIIDNGRGIPTGMHKTEKLPTPQVIFNTLHAGGKFDSEGGYKVAGGLHGVGSSVVNALSEWLELTIHRDGKIYHQVFKNGGKIIEKPKNLGDTKRTGTTIKFKPDGKIFSSTIYDYKTIASRLKESAFLIKGLYIELNDLRTKKSEVFHFQNGLVEYINNITAGKKPMHEAPFFVGSASNIQVEATMLYCDDVYNENILSFVNNIRTRDGGTHEVGFRAAMTRAINDHARLIGILKDKDPNLDGVDIRESLTAIISVRIPENLLQFEGQTKNKLGTPEAKNVVEQVIYDNVKTFLAEKGQIASALIAKTVKAAKAREAARKARDEQRNAKQKMSKPANLIGKLVPPQTRNPQLNELFIVEGDSAGGSAKLGRDSKFQAILPLRGKVLNTARIRFEEILKNEELVSLINAIGTGTGKDFDLSKCNYRRIIIMTDADTDGAHIQTLLLTFFFGYMRPLIENGYVFIATPPLYKITYKNGHEYAWTDEELREKVSKLKNVQIQRYKGLGEMNASQLKETTMDPANRTLIQVEISEESLAEKEMMILMGDDVERRREWIESNVSFDFDDSFSLEDVEQYE